MTINLSESENLSSFVSRHWLAYKCADNQEVLRLTGMVQLNYSSGIGRADQWFTETVNVLLHNPLYQERRDAGKDYGLTINPVHWTVFAVPCAFGFEGTTLGPVWTVESFRLIYNSVIWSSIYLEVKIAVRGTGKTQLWRVAYDVTVTGQTSWEEIQPVN